MSNFDEKRKWIMWKKELNALQALLLALAVISMTGEALAKKQKNGVCKELKLSDIPVINNNGDWHMPEESMRITQTYNNSKSEGWCKVGGVQAPGSSPACDTRKTYYGHDGIDIHRYQGAAGVDGAFAVEDAIVIASQTWKQNSGWGESVAIALRVNAASEEILTFHYAHFHIDSEGTTRNFNACEEVKRGDELGKVGGSGGYPVHLHFTVRRWSNLATLKEAIGASGSALFENGYSYGKDSYLEDGGYLDPYGLLYNTYKDYELKEDGNEPAHVWSLPFAQKMRKLGIEFGLWNGKYGAGELAKRRDIARWMKIAAGLGSGSVATATFEDVPTNDVDFNYIEVLTKHPLQGPEHLKVINAQHTCKDGGKFFCPDQYANRIDTLKMTIMTFYGNDFLEHYDEIVAQAIYHKKWGFPFFFDVGLNDWYLPYVWYGVQKGLVTFNTTFNPGDPVKKEEVAKWVILGYENANGPMSDHCDYVICKPGEHCSPESSICTKSPECVTSETNDCNHGGGVIGDPPHPCDNANCTPGETNTQSCGSGGTQTSTCTDQCQWSPWSDCTGDGPCSNGEISPCSNCGTMTCGSNNQWGPCQGQGECNPGGTQQQTCNAVGQQTSTCNSNCSWSSWSTCTAECIPGQTQQQNCTTGGQQGTQTQACNSSGQWGSWETCITNCQCSSGLCCDGCNLKSSSNVCNSWTEYQCQGSSPGQDAQSQLVQTYCSGSNSSCSGQTQGNGWQTYDNCSSSEVCVMSGGQSQCVPDQSCEDSYEASTSVSCYSGNPSGVEICLYLQQVSGATWKYKICKSGSTFSNNYDYEIIDLKNPSQYLHSGTGQSQSSCTGWHNINMNYITQYGQTNGATLRAQLYSPSGCSQSSCWFRSSLITFWLDC